MKYGFKLEDLKLVVDESSAETGEDVTGTGVNLDAEELLHGNFGNKLGKYKFESGDDG